MKAMLALVPAWVWGLAAAAGAAVLLGIGWRLGSSAGRVDLAEFKLASEHRSEMQRQANRSRTQAAEALEAARTPARTIYITRTIERVRDATATLASCPLPEPAIRLLNRAAECARQDRSATCAADDAVPGAG
ncbi:MAG TPA: hypothetical protein VE084_14380 [Burkholderiaceae bacterium]|nr:hypothetical protein [Burkholderiaceae bacterium]